MASNRKSRSEQPSRGIRLQKVMADAGVASRRACEQLIAAGRVKVDGQVVREMGFLVDPILHEVEVDGETILESMTRTYLAFNKPRGVLSTMSDPEGRPCVGDFLKGRADRLFHVGRLDKESEGLLLLTNDGEWANTISHPSQGVAKRYRVWVSEKVLPEHLKAMRSGLKLEDGSVKAISATSIPGGFEIEIHEGRNQIVRRMAQALGLTVLRLQRIQVGSIKLGELPVGKMRNLSIVETTKH